MATLVRLSLVFVAAVAVLAGGDATAWQVIQKGIRYLEKRPSGQRIYVVRVNLRVPHIGFRATQRRHWHRTVSSFAKLYGASVAVNGDFFSATGVSGLAVANGKILSSDSQESYVAVGADNKVEIQRSAHDSVPNAAVPKWYRQAVGGRPVLLWDGQVGSKVDCEGTLCPLRHPRTALGLSADRKFLFFVVIDGRSQTAAGMTTRGLAGFLKSIGAHWAVNLDGGGSSAMWLKGKGIVNRPSDGRERVVQNHFGVVWQTPFCNGGIRGHVLRTAGGKPVRGAVVSADGGRWKATTNAKGLYELKRVRCGVRSLAVTARGFKAAKRSVTVDPMVVSGRDVKLEAQP